jgi:hypothetical protein
VADKVPLVGGHKEHAPKEAPKETKKGEEEEKAQTAENVIFSDEYKARADLKHVPFKKTETLKVVEDDKEFLDKNLAISIWDTSLQSPVQIKEVKFKGRGTNAYYLEEEMDHEHLMVNFSHDGKRIIFIYKKWEKIVKEEGEADKKSEDSYGGYGDYGDDDSEKQYIIATILDSETLEVLQEIDLHTHSKYPLFLKRYRRVFDYCQDALPFYPHGLRGDVRRLQPRAPVLPAEGRQGRQGPDAVQLQRTEARVLHLRSQTTKQGLHSHRCKQ